MIISRPINITDGLGPLDEGQIMIAIDLCAEWLVFAKSKMMITEYIVNLLTFVACLLQGVETGIVLGIIFAMGAFISSYAYIPVIKVGPDVESARRVPPCHSSRHP